MIASTPEKSYVSSIVAYCRAESYIVATAYDIFFHTLGPNAGIAKSSKFAKHKRRNLKRKTFPNSVFVPSHGWKAPNMSRRVPRATLCAFPAFDKCDSLLFLPVAMARFINSADMKGLQTVLASHKHKQNFLMNYKGLPLALSTFVLFQEILSQVCPDQIMCVHDTKVVGNTIRASLFSKYTDNKVIYEALKPTYKDAFPLLFPARSRADRWKNKLTNSLIPEQDRQGLTELAGEGVDLIVYANMDWVITFDYHTRKVTNFEYSYYLVAVKDGRDSTAGGLEVVRDVLGRH